MFVVPEVDDDNEVSTVAEIMNPIAEPEATQQSLLSASASLPLPIALSPSPPEKVDPVSIASTMPVAAPTVPNKQHQSRRTLFHRNTIHICDQIVERM